MESEQTFTHKDLETIHTNNFREMDKSYGGTFRCYWVCDGTREVAKWATRMYIGENICYFESWALCSY